MWCQCHPHPPFQFGNIVVKRDAINFICNCNMNVYVNAISTFVVHVTISSWMVFFHMVYAEMIADQRSRSKMFLGIPQLNKFFSSLSVTKLDDFTGNWNKSHQCAYYVQNLRTKSCDHWNGYLKCYVPLNGLRLVALKNGHPPTFRNIAAFSVLNIPREEMRWEN